MALVTRDRAAVFVDGRYRLQVRGQVDPACFELLRIPEDKPADWLVAALPGGGRLGFDPWLHTAKEIEALGEALGPRQIGLVPRREPRRRGLAGPAAAARAADRPAIRTSSPAAPPPRSAPRSPAAWSPATSPPRC